MTARPGQIDGLKVAIARIEAASRPLPPLADLATVRRVVAEAAAKVCGCPPEHIREDQTLRCQLGMGGLDQLEFVLAVEEQLGIPPMEAASIVTIGDVVKAAAAAGLR